MAKQKPLNLNSIEFREKRVLCDVENAEVRIGSL